MSDDPRLCRLPHPVGARSPRPTYNRLLYGLAFRLLCRLAFSRSAPSHVPANRPSNAPLPKVATAFSRSLFAPTLPSLRTSAWPGWQRGGGTWQGRGSPDLTGLQDLSGLDLGGPACPPG